MARQIRKMLNGKDPKFANFGTREQHGLARNRLWSLDDDPSLLTPANNQSTADLLLKSTEEDLKTWPYSEVHVEGLQTLDYFDNMSKRERYTEQADTITFDGEIDRVYLSTPTKITIIDHEKKRTIVLRKEGMVDAGWSSSSEGCNKGDIMDL
ncbi:putative glucose-6-phosphate 1-epimerase isoform X3 [Helianthus annuus]|uniref:putative glucose-6-phosphate 1-epimerase isoform X3 n=1 Tax=Helianthus annuus TaxID=4232 RepID=UPI001652C62E|nr:putative glucose-6-phosphate 1-epimerase isoform X3 [Helianthus annuus]XP_035836201.1 putative glucose-6-phosphate 1-epimerase isoform X3 [Helianthus annuus]